MANKDKTYYARQLGGGGGSMTVHATKPSTPASEAAKRFYKPVARTAGSMRGPVGTGAKPVNRGSNVQPTTPWQNALNQVLNSKPERVSRRGWTPAERSQRQATRNIKHAREKMATIQAMAGVESQQLGQTERTRMTGQNNLAVQNLANVGQMDKTRLTERGDLTVAGIQEKGAMARTAAMNASNERVETDRAEQARNRLAFDINKFGQESTQNRTKLIMEDGETDFATADLLSKGYGALATQDADARARTEQAVNMALYGSESQRGAVDLTDPESRKSFIKSLPVEVQAMIHSTYGSDLSELIVPNRSTGEEEPNFNPNFRR